MALCWGVFWMLISPASSLSSLGEGWSWVRERMDSIV